MRFQLIDEAKREFPGQRLCKVLDVGPSGYFAWKNRPASRRQREDLFLLAHVRSAFSLSHEKYGSPRMTYEVGEQGLMAGKGRVADAGERAQGSSAPALPAYDRQPACFPGGTQPARPGFRCRRTEREVGHRSLIHLDAGRLAVSGGGD